VGIVKINDLIAAGAKLPDELLQQAKDRPKYGNRKTVIDDIKFDSQREANEYCELKIRKQAGEILDFDMQVPFKVVPGFARGRKKYRPTIYIADFVVTHLDGTKEVRETKGVKTSAYMIKRKLFAEKFPEYKFTEV